MAGVEVPGQPLPKGVVVPIEQRPHRGGALYNNTRDLQGSPHMLPHSFMPKRGKGGEDLSGPYEPVEGWPEPIDEGWRMAGAAGIIAESPDRIIAVSHYGLLKERTTPYGWGRGLFSMQGSPYAS